MTKLLIVGDPHAHSGYDNDRFGVLGRAARMAGVDRVHCVGDWTDFSSMNMHKSKKEASVASYRDDVEAGNDALERFDEGLDGHPCVKTITLGNHDWYPEQYVSTVDPSLAGTVAWSDVRFKEHGWRATPFRRAVVVSGILCTHFFPSGVGGRAQSGIHMAHSNAMKQGCSCLVGHSHIYDHKIRTYGTGRKVHSWSAGCMVHPKYREDWCRDTEHLWDRGALFIRTGRSGVEMFAWMTQEELHRRFA